MIRLTIKCDVDDASGIEAALDACVGLLNHVESYTHTVSDDVPGECRDEIISAARHAYEDDDIEIDSDAEIDISKGSGDAEADDENDKDGYWVAARLYVKVPRTPVKSMKKDKE